MDGEISQRNGNVDPSIAPFDIYKCKDGFVALGVGNDRLFFKVCRNNRSSGASGGSEIRKQRSQMQELYS